MFDTRFNTLPEEVWSKMRHEASVLAVNQQGVLAQMLAVAPAVVT